MVAPLVIGGIVAGISALGAIFALLRAARKRGDIKGTYSQRSLERQVGLGSVSRQQRQVQDIEERAAQEEEVVEREEEVVEAQTTDKVEKTAVRAVVESVKTSELEEKAEELAGGVEGEVMAVEDALKNNTRGLNEFIYATKDVVLQKEYEEKIIQDIMLKIERAINYGVIDTRVIGFLRQFLAVVVGEISKDIKTEKKKEKDILSLISKLQASIRIMRRAIAGAKRNLFRLKRAEKKIHRSFKKEFAYFKDYLKAKVKELKRLRSINAEPNVIAQLEREIGLLKEQRGIAITINGQLEETYQFMRKEIKQMRRLLNYVKNNERQIERYAEALLRRKKRISERIIELGEAASAIEQMATEFTIQNPHEFALIFSGRIKKYFDVRISLIQQDIDFNSYLEGIAIKDFLISKQMEAFQEFQKSFTNSQKAVDSGESAIIKLLSAILGDRNRINCQKAIQVLQKATTILDYEVGIEQYMENLATVIKRKSSQLYQIIKQRTDAYQVLLAKIQSKGEGASEHLGSMMGTMVQRKIDVNNAYMPEAVRFGEQLIKTNEAVGRGYAKALRAESYAAAA